VNVAQARAKVKANGNRYRSALIEADGVPMTDGPTTIVRLFETVKAGEVALGERLDVLTEDGYATTWGSKSRGFVRLEHVATGDEKALALDKPRSKRNVLYA
jgi:hypothetical protein